MPDQFLKGLDVIRRATEEALINRDVQGATVTFVSDDKEKPTALLTISAGGTVDSQTFAYDEIEDSGEAIDAPAALKMRMLVSKFVR